MDRQTNALKFLVRQVDELKQENDLYKLFMYWSFPWIIGLALSALNIENYLAGAALVFYDDFRATGLTEQQLHYLDWFCQSYRHM